MDGSWGCLVCFCGLQWSYILKFSEIFKNQLHRAVRAFSATKRVVLYEREHLLVINILIHTNEDQDLLVDNIRLMDHLKYKILP